MVCLGSPWGVSEDSLGIPVAIIGGGSWIHWIRSARKEIRSWQPHVVHTTLFQSDIVGRLASIATGATVVSSLVNDSYGADRRSDPRVSRVKLALVRLVDAFTARHCVDRFHALTVAVAQAAVRDLGIDPLRIDVIPRGRDGRLFSGSNQNVRAEVRRELGIAEEAQVIVTVGRQEYQKGQVHLVAALTEISKNHPGAVLLLVGREGNATAEIREAAAMFGNEPVLRIVGERSDVHRLLAAADLFVFPSLFEGLGGAVIEAMGSGLPIVASDIPALREVLGGDENAVLVARGDSRALARAVNELFADPKRMNALGARGRAIFEARYELEAVVDETVRFYRRLLVS
jgi:glycosyltransferase involved in cell wall biosynthesis